MSQENEEQINLPLENLDAPKEAAQPEVRKISKEDLEEFTSVIGGARAMTERANAMQEQTNIAIQQMRDAEAEVRYVGRKLNKKYEIAEDELVDLASGTISKKK